MTSGTSAMWKFFLTAQYFIAGEVFGLPNIKYVKNGITSWIKKWKVNGWMTANRKPVLNRELWIALDNAYNKLDVEWNWVKGHAGVKYNEICDQLCKMEMGKF